MADNLREDGMGDQLKGMGKEAEGKIRNGLGGLTGDTSEQLKGKAKELEGKGQQKLGQAKNDLADDLEPDV